MIGVLFDELAEGVGRQVPPLLLVEASGKAVILGQGGRLSNGGLEKTAMGVAAKITASVNAKRPGGNWSRSIVPGPNRIRTALPNERARAAPKPAFEWVGVESAPARLLMLPLSGENGQEELPGAKMR